MKSKDYLNSILKTSFQTLGMINEKIWCGILFALANHGSNTFHIIGDPSNER